MIIVAVAALLTAPSSLPAPSVKELDRDVLSYRESMDRMSVTWRSTMFHFPKEERTKSMTSVIKLWRDGKRLRTDVIRSNPGMKSIRELVGRNCEMENTSVYWVDKPGKNIVVSFQPLSDAPFRTMRMIDPRLLGMYPSFSANLNLSKRHLESFIGRPDRENVKVEKADFDGHPSWLVRYRLLHGTGVDVREWVVPEWGPSVGRIEAEWQSNNHHYFDYVDCTYERNERSGKWYPKTCTYLRKTDGKPEREEDLEVQSLAMNEVVPADAFQLSGMEIPRGKEVVGVPVPKYPGARGARLWDGHQLVAIARKSTPSSKAELAQNKSSGRWRQLLVANSIFLAVIAALFIWWSSRAPAR